MTGPGIVSEVKRIMALSLPSLGGVGDNLIPPGATFLQSMLIRMMTKKQHFGVFEGAGIVS